MMSKPSKKLTNLESIIMDTVWNLGKASVREVQGELETTKPMAYNTVLTMMRILRDKGFLSSTRHGRLDIYKPTISRENAGKGGLHDLLHTFFSGSAKALVSQLIDDEDISVQEMKEIREELNRKLRSEATK